MYLVNKDKNQIINMDHVASLFIGGDECSIKVGYADGGGCQAARYAMPGMATAVIEQLGKAIGHTDVFFFPDDDNAQELLRRDEKWHHATGKKTKSHGGS